MVYLKYIRKNNILEFSDGVKSRFNIKRDTIGYYTTLFDDPFRKLNIDKVKLSLDALGYYEDGRFPYCKSNEDVLILLRALQKKSKIKYYMDNEL